MQIGMIGLGRMGGGLARRLQRAGHHCVVFDQSEKAVRDLQALGMTGARGLSELVAALAPPRAVWIMLSAGAVTEEAVQKIASLLSPGDCLIDGGNSYYKDDIRRAKDCAAKGVSYIDVGTSGGVFGLERGFCLMIGGDIAVVARLDPIFRALAPGLGEIQRTPGRAGRDPRAELGYVHTGPPGSGHFVKMVHNAVEYGLMQAYAEGFDILRGKASAALPEDQRFDLDVAEIAEVWRRGSVISSWLLDLAAIALNEDDSLSSFSGDVADSGEARWTMEAAIEQASPANVLAASLFERFRSRRDHTFGDKLLSALRRQFGGHVEDRSRE